MWDLGSPPRSETAPAVEAQIQPPGHQGIPLLLGKNKILLIDQISEDDPRYSI